MIGFAAVVAERTIRALIEIFTAEHASETQLALRADPPPTGRCCDEWRC
jgi:hypothetical protein